MLWFASPLEAPSPLMDPPILCFEGYDIKIQSEKYKRKENSI